LEEIKSFTKENNKRENSSLKRIGNFIKEARLSRDKSIEELASDLKIGAHQLKAIEEGNEEKLPEIVFVTSVHVNTTFSYPLPGGKNVDDTTLPNLNPDAPSNSISKFKGQT